MLNFFPTFLLHLLRRWCSFCPWFHLCDVLRLLICLCCTILVSWDETYRIMVYDLFNVLLDSAIKYFIEDSSGILLYNFLFLMHLYLVLILRQYGLYTMSLLVILPFFILWDSLKSIGVSYLKVWWIQQ
jgi:hypothetical protein